MLAIPSFFKSTFALLLSKTNDSLEKIRCFDSYSLIFPFLCPRANRSSLRRSFLKINGSNRERKSDGSGKELIAISLFRSQKTNDSHEKTKERIANPEERRDVGLFKTFSRIQMGLKKAEIYPFKSFDFQKLTKGSKSKLKEKNKSLHKSHFIHTVHCTTFRKNQIQNCLFT